MKDDLKVKHPSTLHGVFAYSFKLTTPRQDGEEGEVTTHVQIREDLDDGILHVTEKMGGKALVDHLVATEGWLDVSKYSTVANPATAPSNAKDDAQAWELTPPWAQDHIKQNGNVGTKKGVVPIVQSIVYTKDPDIMEELIEGGWRVVKAHRNDFRAKRPLPANLNPPTPAQVVELPKAADATPADEAPAEHTPEPILNLDSVVEAHEPDEVSASEEVHPEPEVTQEKPAMHRLKAGV